MRRPVGRVGMSEVNRDGRVFTWAMHNAFQHKLFGMNLTGSRNRHMKDAVSAAYKSSVGRCEQTCGLGSAMACLTSGARAGQAMMMSKSCCELLPVDQRCRAASTCRHNCHPLRL